MSENILFVGLDVDDNAFHGAALQVATGEVADFKIRPTLKGLIAKLEQLKLQLHASELRICYEATYIGFSEDRIFKRYPVDPKSYGNRGNGLKSWLTKLSELVLAPKVSQDPASLSRRHLNPLVLLHFGRGWALGYDSRWTRTVAVGRRIAPGRCRAVYMACARALESSQSPRLLGWRQ